MARMENSYWIDDTGGSQSGSNPLPTILGYDKAMWDPESGVKDDREGTGWGPSAHSK